MRLEDFQPKEIGPRDVRVRMRAASANPMDFGIRNGRMKTLTGRNFPRGMGYDFAGTVEAVGNDVTRVRIGDDVLGGVSIKESGAFADVVVAREDDLVKKPAGLSFEAAAAIPVVGITAYQALFNKGNLRRGGSVFVHASLGGVGRSAVQLASARGATVAGSCRPGSAGEARALGVDPIVDFDFAPDVLQQKFDVVLDAAGTLPVKTARKILARKGRIVTVKPSPVNMARSALPGPFRVVVGQSSTADLEAIAQAAGDGHLSLPIAQVVPLSEAIPALTNLEQNGTAKRGKLIIVPG